MVNVVNWERTASMVVCFFAFGGVLYLAVRYAFPVLLPFLIAWVLSLAIRPMARSVSDRFRIPQKLCAVGLLLLILGGLLALTGLSLWRLMQELEHLLNRLLEQGDLQEPVDFFETVTSRIGFLRRLEVGERFAAFRTTFNETVSELLLGLFQSLTSAIPRWLGGFASALPSALFVSVVTVIASFYFCLDGERISGAVLRLLPKGLQGRVPAWKAYAKTLSLRYLKTYLLLLLLTFAELFLGFSLLGIEYAFLLALLISVVDLLPILGVGTVLLPWAIFLLLDQRFGLGIGILFLYLAVTVLRQILEPRFLGISLGVHPLLALFSSYVGWRFLGFWGLLLGPVFALLVRLLASQLGRTKRMDV